MLKCLWKEKQLKKSEFTREVGGWVQVSLGFSFCGKSSRHCSKSVLIFWSSIQCVFFLLKVVNDCDLSGLYMSVMGFQKKVWMGGGWVG